MSWLELESAAAADFGADRTSSGRPAATIAAGGRVAVELTADGYLHLDAEVAGSYFPTDALVALRRGDELWLLPLVGTDGGGLLLKQRNRRGDRSTLIWEALGDQPVVGARPAVWDAEAAALRVALAADDGTAWHGVGRGSASMAGDER